jgi:hypothetical protein
VVAVFATTFCQGLELCVAADTAATAPDPTWNGSIMKTLEYIVLEQPIWAYAMLAAAEFLILGLWRRGRLHWAILTVPPLLAAAVFLAGTFIETDAMRLNKSLKTIAQRLGAGDVQGVGEFLADDFHGDYHSKQEALDQAKRSMAEYGIGEIEVTHVRVDMEKGGTEAAVQARTAMRINGAIGQGIVVLNWTIHWSRISGAWRITSVSSPQTGPGM